MLRKISNLGAILNKKEQKSIQGGGPCSLPPTCRTKSDCYNACFGPGDVFCTAERWGTGYCGFY